MLLALVAVIIVAPFERALFVIAGVTMTSSELVTVAAVAMYGAAWFRDGAGAVPSIPRALLFAAALFLVVIGVAALMTPVEAGNAWRFVARMATAFGLTAMTLHVVNSPARARLIAWVMAVVATVVALIAVLELLQLAVVMTALTSFRPGFHVVAGQLRATSTLFYPTIASMYLEVAFVVGLWLLLTARRGRLAAFLALVLIGAGIIATFTRAGLLAMATAIATLAFLRVLRLVRTEPPVRDARRVRAIARRWGAREPMTLAALTGALTAFMFVAHAPELLAARLTTQGSHEWYGASYDVPRTLSMTTAAHFRVPVSVTNTGKLTWDSEHDPAFALSYHWLQDYGAPSDRVVEFEGRRTPFVQPVRPGTRVDLAADVMTPGAPGTYTLVWDVVHETRTWLSTEGVKSGRTLVTVSGAPRETTSAPMTQLPGAVVRPERPQLWKAALRMARDYPWLGVGPDNYRLLSGRYLGTTAWDPRVHANNMYLELLAGAGVPGLIALLGLVAVVGITLWSRLQRARADTHTAAAAAFALWLVVAGHGLVDSFLGFTTTYVSFAIAGGWALSPGLIEGASDADCV
jgi:hypothetical protein